MKYCSYCHSKENIITTQFFDLWLSLHNALQLVKFNTILSVYLYKNMTKILGLLELKTTNYELIQ